MLRKGLYKAILQHAEATNGAPRWDAQLDEHGIEKDVTLSTSIRAS